MLGARHSLAQPCCMPLFSALQASVPTVVHECGAMLRCYFTKKSEPGMLWAIAGVGPAAVQAAGHWLRSGGAQRAAAVQKPGGPTVDCKPAQ